MTRGDVVCFRKQVSNWGHIEHFPVVVLHATPKRVRVQTLDLKRNRDISVKPENLHPLASTEYCATTDTSRFLATVEQIKSNAKRRRLAREDAVMLVQVAHGCSRVAAERLFAMARRRDRATADAEIARLERIERESHREEEGGFCS